MGKAKEAIVDPLSENNPITVLVLGICSALAVTVKMETAIVMCISVMAVLIGSNFLISLLRKVYTGQNPHDCTNGRDRIPGNPGGSNFKGLQLRNQQTA